MKNNFTKTKGVENEQPINIITRCVGTYILFDDSYLFIMDLLKEREQR
jgi:hypothetical protein